MKSLDELGETLRRIDGSGYGAYKRIAGGYRAEGMTLFIDHVQGDPFAAPSRLRALVPYDETALGELGEADQVADVARADYLLRLFASACARIRTRRGSGKSGLIDVDVPGQQVIERSACMLTDEGIELRFNVGLPAQGRRVLGRQAHALLTQDVPRAVRHATGAGIEPDALAEHVRSVCDAHALRGMLADEGLVAFVADGALLPRNSGVDQRPMDRAQAVAFQSPPELRKQFTLPSGRSISGMGIERGVTLIVGGGYHGKSTLLRALTLGVYEHVPGDGRELTVSDAGAVTIRAEDGRRVEGVDIGAFIDNLPGGRDTRRFRSDDASGSTSQAAAVMEAIEAGARVLLIDEDTAATNFMIRDGRMQQLIAKAHEPITPFIDRVRQLYDERGVSSVLVIGGSGDYFEVADRVIAMRDYQPHDVSEQARAIAQQPSPRAREGQGALPQTASRKVLRGSVDASKGRRAVKLTARGLRQLQLGEHEIDLSALDQLVAVSQVKAIGRALAWLADRHINGRATVSELLDVAQDALNEVGMDAFDGRRLGDLASFRRHELAAALNRLRSLRVD